MPRVSPARKLARLASSVAVGAIAIGAFAAMPAHAAKHFSGDDSGDITITVVTDANGLEANGLRANGLADDLRANGLRANGLANGI